MIALIASALMITACGESEDDIAFEGGGFIFNYRIAEAFYGVNVKPMRRLKAGTILEVSFENPAGGEPIIVRQTVGQPKLRYTFRTPALRGIQKDKKYTVVARLLSQTGEDELARITRTLKSDVDQSVLPARPLVVGPGYHRPDDDPNTQPAQ